MGWPVYAADSDIKLPKPSLAGKLSVEAAIVGKKSVRDLKAGPLTLASIGQLLWATNGNLPADAISGATSKVIPSAGGLYPLEVFLATGPETVSGVPAGVYRYDPQQHALQPIAQGDVRPQLANAALSQMWMARSPALIVIGGVMTRTTSKYGNRGINYVLMEVGSATQNLYLQAESLKLHVASVGAFNDPQVAAVLKLPATVTPFMIVPVGN
jgi:SagB-type dehydrogenase family enzyme